MADLKTLATTRPARLLSRTMLGGSMLVALAAAQGAQAQGRVVSACSGVSLPPSVVTNILSPVLTGITGPTESTVNGILAAPLLGVVLPPLALDTTGLLAQAAAGAPITLDVLATDGTVVGPADQCSVTSDSITLDTQTGVAIGGNQITGLGANGAAAFADDIDAIALGNDARAEAGATGSVAIGSGSRATAAGSVALGAGSVAARGATAGYAATGLATPQDSAGEVSVGAPGALRQITNVAAGTAPSDAATVGQVAGVLAQATALDATSVKYDGAGRDRVTLAGAAGTTIANVAPGTVAAGSTEAVNGAQLFATNTQVAANTSAIAGLDTRVAANTAAIAGLETRVAGSALAAVRYSDRATPTTPNGGTPTNDITLVGADAGAAVGLHNVAAGTVAAGSTDAVNGGQLFGVATAASNSVQYDRNASGARTNTVTLAGGNAAAPVTIANVAAGTVAAGSTQAVNGAQLFATDQVAQRAAALGANSVQYGPGGTAVTFANAGGTPVVLRNVAAGTSTTDAVNVGQLQAGLQSAVAQAGSYTDARFAAVMTSVDFDLRRVRRDLGAGTSAAMAAAALPQATEAGRTMVAIGGGTYRGQSAVAFGASTFLGDGHSILRIGATYDSRGRGGANAGYGYQF